MGVSMSSAEPSLLDPEPNHASSLEEDFVKSDELSANSWG